MFKTVAKYLKQAVTEATTLETLLDGGTIADGLEDIVKRAIADKVFDWDVVIKDPLTTWITSNMPTVLASSFSGLLADVGTALTNSTNWSTIWAMIVQFLSGSAFLTWIRDETVWAPLIPKLVAYIILHQMSSVLTPLVDAVVDYLKSKYLAGVHNFALVGEMIKVAWGTSSDVYVWGDSLTPVKPFMWVSNALQKVCDAVTDGINEIVDELPNDFVLHLPFSKIAWKIVNESHEVGSVTIPDFNYEMKPWKFCFHGLYIKICWNLPIINDFEITGSEDWNYVVNGVYGAGNSFNPVHKMMASEVIIELLFWALIITACTYLAKAGQERIANSIIKTATIKCPSIQLQPDMKMVNQALTNVKDEVTSTALPKEPLGSVVDKLNAKLAVGIPPEGLWSALTALLPSSTDEILTRLGVIFPNDTTLIDLINSIPATDLTVINQKLEQLLQVIGLKLFLR